MRLTLLSMILATFNPMDILAYGGLGRGLEGRGTRRAATRERGSRRGPSDRAVRPDAPSYPGSTPQVVSPYDSSLLAAIKKCVCELKNIVESDFEVLLSAIENLSLTVNCSGLDSVASMIEVVIESGFDRLCSKVENINVNLSGIDSVVTEIDILLSQSDDILCAVGSKTDFAYSDTAIFTSLDGINNTEISLISWVKTIMRELRGV